jgi:hypothetical protein
MLFIDVDRNLPGKDINNMNKNYNYSKNKKEHCFILKGRTLACAL